MLYFVTYPDWQGHWHKYYNRAVCRQLHKLNLQYQRVVTDYYSSSIDSALQDMQAIRSKQTDAWLFSTAQNPAVELVEQKPGFKYGHVHNLECMRFEPSRLQGISLREKRRLNYYDRVFFSSRWSLQRAQNSYPGMSARFVLTGFPMDYEIYQPYRQIAAQPDLVVFNQRFACERLPPVEVELAARLIKNGFRVQHLHPSANGLPRTGCPLTKQLRRLGEEAGIEFVGNDNKHQYHARLARAGCVITTSICDNLPVALIEGIRLGAVPVAPRGMCFPEFVHQDNMYRPYDLAAIERIVRRAPRRVHAIAQYARQKVVNSYIKAMRMSGYCP